MSVKSKPPVGAFAITPSDSVNTTRRTRGIYVGVTGNLAVIMESGETVTFSNIAAGQIHPMSVDRVLSSGTTATGLVGVD